MTVCSNSSPKKRKICTGDLKDQIEIQTRALSKSGSGFGIDDVDIAETFTTVATVWSAIKTTRGYKSFNDVGFENDVTHKFFIRFDSTLDITSENWILFDGDRYEIKDVEDMEERGTFLILYAIKAGDETLDANKA